MSEQVLDAIYKLYPAVVRTVGNQAFDADGNQVELDQSLVDAELAATEYQRQRAPEYPSMAALADALYWNSTGDSTKLDEYYAACAAVKAKYPKPETD